jgi:hypothetical protein
VPSKNYAYIDVVTLSSVIVGGVYVWNLEKEHAEHVEHILHENGGVMPHAEYEYLHRRLVYPSVKTCNLTASCFQGETISMGHERSLLS